MFYHVKIACYQIVRLGIVSIHMFTRKQKEILEKCEGKSTSSVFIQEVVNEKL